MHEVVGGTHFLVLRSDGESPRIIECVPRFDEALKTNDGLLRLSPIVSLDRAPTPNFRDSKTSLFFVGPIFPGDVSFESSPHLYLTYGLHNLLVWCTVQSQSEEVREYLQARQIIYEEWTVNNSEIIARTPFAGVAGGPILTPAALEFPDAADVLPTAREYRIALAAALERSHFHRNPDLPTLLAFDKVFRELLKSIELTASERLQMLVTANVAVARHCWQTYAGSFPIFENRSHLATHSLLGVGIGSVALHRLSRQIETRLERLFLIYRMSHLQNVPAQGIALIGISASNSFWLKDDLTTHGFDAPPDIEASEPALPQISYFSNRDGFRSTHFSITAPMECVGGCSIPAWTLQTLTHEVIHNIVRATLGQLLPEKDDLEGAAILMNLMKTPSKARSLYEEARSLLATGILIMNLKTALLEFTDASSFLQKLSAEAKEADEVLTHILDYLYHYSSNILRFTESLWTSWSTIPHIESRLLEYLTRTLCALHAAEPRRDPALAVDTLAENLRKVQEQHANLEYIAQARELLEGGRDEFILRIRRRMPLILFARHFLFSENLLREAEKGAFPDEELKPLIFDNRRVANGLRFVHSHVVGEKTDHRRSLWLLQHLAFES